MKVVLTYVSFFYIVFVSIIQTRRLVHSVMCLLHVVLFDIVALIVLVHWAKTVSHCHLWLYHISKKTTGVTFSTVKIYFQKWIVAGLDIIKIIVCLVWPYIIKYQASPCFSVIYWFIRYCAVMKYWCKNRTSKLKKKLLTYSCM